MFSIKYNSELLKNHQREALESKENLQLGFEPLQFRERFFKASLFGPLRSRSTPWQKKSRKMLFSFIRFVLLIFGWTKNRYFTSNIWINNPLRALKDIKISAKSVGHTHHIKFSDPINLALRTYSQSSDYDKQSEKPSSYR